MSSLNLIFISTSLTSFTTWHTNSNTWRPPYMSSRFPGMGLGGSPNKNRRVETSSWMSGRTSIWPFFDPKNHQLEVIPDVLLDVLPDDFYLEIPLKSLVIKVLFVAVHGPTLSALHQRQSAHRPHDAIWRGEVACRWTDADEGKEEENTVTRQDHIRQP